VDDEDADGGGDPRQLRRAVDLGVIHIEASGQTTGGDGLTQAVEEAIETLIGIELGVRDQAAGIVERGLQEHLHLAATGALYPRAEEHVGLPDLVGMLGFILFVPVGGGAGLQQLPLGKSTGAQETIERRRGDFHLIPRQGQVIEQSRSSAMRAFALEAFDERGGGVWDDAGRPFASIAERPLKQRVHRNPTAGGMRNVVEARGDLMDAARQFRRAGASPATSGAINEQEEKMRRRAAVQQCLLTSGREHLFIISPS